MEARSSLYFLLAFLHLSFVCVAEYSNCQIKPQYSGQVYFHGSSASPPCFRIEVPEDSYVRLEIKELDLANNYCSSTHVILTVDGTGDIFKFCRGESYQKAITSLHNITITYATGGYTIKFHIFYKIENLICAQRNHFRCSNHSCIQQYKVCDEVIDCENGADEIGCETGLAAFKGVNVSRANGITWLKNQRSPSFGWGINTHRAISALYLAGAATFRGDDLEEELMAKQLELKALVALLRNSTDPLSVGDLSMFINALTVTCHNPRQFYGYDLLQILEDRATHSKIPSPAAYLTLCNSNWTFTESHLMKLLKILYKNSEYPFRLDVRAMTVMALACMQRKTKNFGNISNATELYNATIEQFIGSQLPDGNFGNIYTTALVTQALLSSGQENNKMWKVNSTVNYLMRELNSSADFLSIYLTLPIFRGKSISDITNINCTNSRKHGPDYEISDVTYKLGGKMNIQYSLYVGDQKDVIHTIYLRMPEESSAYDIMRMAQMVDYKYKFLQGDAFGQMYVYAIAGITNDPEAGKFWLLYTAESLFDVNATVHHHTEGPDQLILGDEEHLIMWYKTAHI